MIHLIFFDIKKRILGIIYYILSLFATMLNFFFQVIPFPLSFEDQNKSCILKKQIKKKKKHFSIYITFNLAPFHSGNSLITYSAGHSEFEERNAYTASKVSKYGVISGPYFPTFGVNTERYFTRNNSAFGHFSHSGIYV